MKGWAIAVMAPVSPLRMKVLKGHRMPCMGNGGGVLATSREPIPGTPPILKVRVA